jgi:hypothetical protein
MSSGWTLVGSLVKLLEESDTVRVGPDQGTAAPLPRLEVAGSARATLQDKGGNVFDVKAYGAKGDGTTDDLAKIQDAIAALRTAGGGTLYFPPGNYVVSAEIVIDGYNPSPAPGHRLPFLVRGAGPQATSLLSSSATANTIRTTYGGAVALGRELFMEVRDIMFGVASGVTKTGGDAIRQECNPGFQNTFLVRNCWFRDVFNGVHLTATGSATIKDCVIVNPVNAAIFLEQFTGGGASDVGTTSINDNYIFQKPTGTGIYGVWATTGASGLRVQNNYFLGFAHQLLIDMVPLGLHTQILIDGNAFDGSSSFPSLQITGFGICRRFAISNNRFTANAPVGIQIDVGVLAGQSGTVQHGSITDNVIDLLGGSSKGMVLDPTAAQGITDVLISGNKLSNVGTGLQIGPNAQHIFLSENAFDSDTVPTLVVNNGDKSRGAFFPDRLGVGRINDVTSGGASVVKEIYASSDHPVRPRVYLQGLAGTSSPGIDFAFDNTNTRRASIVGVAKGSAATQLEFYTKADDANPLKRRAILDPNGRFQLLGTTPAPLLPAAIDFIFDAESSARASVVATPQIAGAQLELSTTTERGVSALRAIVSPRGHFLPGADNAYTLGQSSPQQLRWKDIVAVTKTSALNTSFGSGVTLLPVLEGPEYLLYDGGSVTLGQDGQAVVDLDPRFVEIANTDMPYRVLTSGCKVKDKAATRFRLTGDPGDAVDWMVMAVRAGFENVRFRDAQDADPVGLQDPEHAAANKGPANNKA